jgi:glycosyltransferase 2 family protein
MRRERAERLKSQVVWIGRVLSAAALTAVAAYFVRMRVWRTVDLGDPRLYAALPGLVAIYVAGFVAQGYAWVRWLRSAGTLPFAAATGIRIYCRTQIAKYVPGNVFHFVARHASGNRLGASHSALVLASAAETAALVTVAGTLAALGGGLPSRFPPIPRVAALSVAVLAVVLAVPLAARLGGVHLAHRPAVRRWFDTFLTLLLYVPLFAGSSLCLAVLFSLNHAGPSPSPGTLTGIWSMCWLAGYLVPGSPAGLGVRDAALVYALSAWCGRAEAVVLATEMRLVATLGDVALWLAAVAWRPWKAPEGPAQAGASARDRLRSPTARR